MDYFIFGGGFALGLVVTFFALRYQQKKIQEALNTIYKQTTLSIGKAYQDGAKAMAAKMEEEIARIKRIKASVPFVIATGNTFDKMRDGNKSRISIAGIHWEHAKDSRVPLLEDHKWEKPAIGDVFPFIEEGELKAVINFRESKYSDFYKNLYPSIGGVVDAKHEEEIDGETVIIIDRFHLSEVSLSAVENADLTIKPLAEQMKF